METPSKWEQNGNKTGTRYFITKIHFFVKWEQNGNKMGTKWEHRGKMGTKWEQNSNALFITYIDFFENGNKMGTKQEQKWEQKWSSLFLNE